jgi:hypothetical protein
MATGRNAEAVDALRAVAIQPANATALERMEIARLRLEMDLAGDERPARDRRPAGACRAAFDDEEAVGRRRPFVPELEELPGRRKGPTVRAYYMTRTLGDISSCVRPADVDQGHGLGCSGIRAPSGPARRMLTEPRSTAGGCG